MTNKTFTKAEVKNFIKAHGTEKFDGTVEATINGHKYGYCGNIIVDLESGYKFPRFREVEIYDGELWFTFGRMTNAYDNKMRKNKVVDAYWSLIEAMYE